ncbi:diguanylate cyclase [Devosia marina]|uniref:GGDEF domain-containing protein n=1 Tax=Devosia marina TaxID=2683198 RepID=UPI0012FCE376
MFEEFDAKLPGASSTIVIFDLDQFKLINDNMGHAHGDELLKRFADTLGTPIRATASAGIAIPGKEEPFSSVLSRADAAHDKAEQAGRNQVHIAPFRLVA